VIEVRAWIRNYARKVHNAGPGDGNWQIPFVRLVGLYKQYLTTPGVASCSYSLFSKAFKKEKNVTPKLVYSKRKDHGTLCDECSRLQNDIIKAKASGNKPWLELLEQSQRVR
jgi:hypothetical protein